MQITVSAPGKIHLLGEHVVVYGKPALLAAINKRLYATIKIKNQKSKIKNIDEIQIKSENGTKLIKSAIRIFQNAFKIKDFPSLEISVSSQIPVGSGLGSSAAIAVSVIGALMKTIKNIWNPNKINELAYEVEKLQHGNPSGGDNTVVTFGGLIWYRREFDFLKSIWTLPIINYKIPPFLIINSGKPYETTGEMVASVAYLYKKKKKWFEGIMLDQEQQTKNLLLALKNDDKKELIYSFKSGEKNLEKIGAVGSQAKEIIREIESVGGAAKVCGGGGRKKGSGILLCYHEDLAKLVKIGEKYNLSYSSVKLGGEGIRIENVK